MLVPDRVNKHINRSIIFDHTQHESLPQRTIALSGIIIIKNS
jgi:hypothetical protein